MKHVKMIGIVILAAAFIALIIALKWRVSNHVVEKEETRNSCDYFNGEVTEASKEASITFYSTSYKGWIQV